MKNLFLLFIASCLLLIASCKKDDKTPATTTTTGSPYYFKFTINGASYNLNANYPQYIFSYPNIAGGYQIASTGFFPSATLSFNWPNGDTVRESDVMGLIGKTLYFNDTSLHPQPEVDFAEVNTTVPTWYSVDTSNTSYYVKVANVTFLKKDTTAGVPVRTYVITGTCNAVVSQSDSTSVFSAGSFNFVISRMDL
jgi:hypothetical protein